MMRQSGPRRPVLSPGVPYVAYERVSAGDYGEAAAAEAVVARKGTDVLGLDMSSAGIGRVVLSYARFGNMTHLYLQKNSLREFPAAVCALSRLQVLDVSYNSITALPQEMGKLYHLRELDISCNRLEDLSLEVFGRFCRLETLRWEGNNIVSGPPLSVMQLGGPSIFRYACDNMQLANPPERPLTHLLGEHEQAQLQAAGHIKLSVVCYNVLAELYATQERHPYCPTWALAWSNRQMRLLLEILSQDAAVICLQEVETAQFAEFFSPRMKQAGYDGTFQAKSRHRTMGNGSRVDGCAIFWKRGVFGLVEEHLVEFQSEASQRMEEFAGDGLNRLILKDNIALLVVLEIWSTRQKVLVANTHIHWDPQFSDVKLVQTQMFLEKLTAMQEQHGGRSLPVIISGDFNSTPDSGVFELVTTGRLPPDHPELRNHSYGNYSTAGMAHTMNLVSCYPPTTQYTNCTHEFQGVLDYIFVTSETLRVAAILNPVPMEQLPLPALPNPFHPSDHIALVAHLIF